MNRNGAYRMASLILLTLNVLLLCSLAAGIVATSSRFRAVYEDLNAALPALTTWLLQIPPVVWLAPTGLLVVGLLVKEVAIARPAVRLWINVAFLLLSLALAATWALALCLPMVNLMQSVA